MTLPMLADFSIRLGAGLAALLLLTSWREVPPAFFRTHCHIVLGLFVLAALDLARGTSQPLALWLSIAAAGCAFLAAIAWGLGVPRIALPLSGLIVALGCLLEAAAVADSSRAAWALGILGRFSSAFLLGSIFTAMLLGHHYLTAPSMSIAPLKHLVGLTALALVLRAGLAGEALGAFFVGHQATSTLGLPWFLVGARWGSGIVAPAIATFLAWRTVAIRSTQSATGILFVTALFILFGELTALNLARQIPALAS
jgi:hypothetical protein